MRPNTSLASSMSFLFIGLTVICFCISASSASSDILLRFASTISGNFTHRESIFGYFNFRPVEMDVFSPNVTYYYKQSVGEKRLVVVLEEDNDGQIILKNYLLTIPFPHSPTLDDLALLKSLTLADLDYRSGCDSKHFEIAEEIFFGEWASCELYGDQTKPYVVTVAMCDVWAFMIMDLAGPPVLFEPSKRFELPPSFCGGSNCKKVCK